MTTYATPRAMARVCILAESDGFAQAADVSLGLHVLEVCRSARTGVAILTVAAAAWPTAS